jgi:hypothetical protein
MRLAGRTMKFVRFGMGNGRRSRSKNYSQLCLPLAAGSRGAAEVVRLEVPGWLWRWEGRRGIAEACVCRRLVVLKA